MGWVDLFQDLNLCKTWRISQKAEIYFLGYRESDPDNNVRMYTDMTWLINKLDYYIDLMYVLINCVYEKGYQPDIIKVLMIEEI